MARIDLKWIAQKMEYNRWYNIKDEEQLRQIMQLIDKGFGFDKFTLTLSSDYKRVRKTEI